MITLKEVEKVIFMSVGSGVNFQLYGSTEKGIERLAASDPSLTTGDGYFLEGTSLGAGFLMGVGKLLTSEEDYSVIL